VPLLLLILPVLSTVAGGLLALRFRRSLAMLIALGAGLLLGAAFLDILPEALAIGNSGAARVSSATVLALTLAAFLSFFALQCGLDAVAAHSKQALAPGTLAGRIGGSLLIFHSLRDGVAIGLAYAASHPVGYAVAVGIVAHDLGDGMNTVILTTRGRKPTYSDYLFLAADALAPMLGGLLTIWWRFSPRSSVFLLATAAGFFIQMATTEFLAEIRLSRPYTVTLLAAASRNRLIGESAASTPPGIDESDPESGSLPAPLPATFRRRYLLGAVFAGSALIYAANMLLQHTH
jgi:zinc and cadmium transporter